MRRKHYEGTRASNGIGPVHLVSEQDARNKVLQTGGILTGRLAAPPLEGRIPGVDAELAKKIARKNKMTSSPSFTFLFLGNFTKMFCVAWAAAL